jgi:ribosomal protein S18 acetylase RimI-like enzyme
VQLNLSLLGAFADFVSFLQDEVPEAVLERMTCRVQAGDLDLADTFVELSSDGLQVTGCIRLVRRGQDEAILMPWRGREGCGTRDSIRRLLVEARRRACELGARSLGTRVHDAQMTPNYRGALLDAGFEPATRRIEYKTPLAEMPTEDSSDLVWKTMAQTGEDSVLDLLQEASIGSPDGVDTNVGSAAIAGLLDADSDALDARTVQVGHLNGQAVAVLFCLATPQDGWSTIAFIGVVPSHRKRGLGLQAHRHGIATLRELGGTIYHDGTSESNEPMRRLFAKQGCIEFARMEEWHAALQQH